MALMETEILQAEERLRTAMLAGDVSELDALIDDRLLFVGPDGGAYSKADDLELHRSGAERVTRIDVAEIQVRMHGSTAVAMVVADMAGEFQGTAFAGRFRYLRVWVRAEQGWKIAGGSVCAAPPTAE